jgi:hypothetical protein
LKKQEIIKNFLVVIFTGSAIAKLWDLKNTMVYFATLLKLEINQVKFVLVFFIVAELLFAVLVFCGWLKYNVVYYVLVSLMLFFICFNLFFLLNGYDNCGCFGTTIITSPLTSLCKNILLIGAIMYLRKRLVVKTKIYGIK